MPDKGLPKQHLLVLLKDAGEVFKLCSRRTKILSTLAWGPEVMAEFFRKKEAVSPRPVYSVDKKSLAEAKEMLERLELRLRGEHPILQWLARVRASFLMGVSLLQELEKPAFYELSSQIYGNPGSRLFKSTSSNLDLARGIAGRMAVPNVNDINESLVQKSAEEFASDLEKKLKERTPILPVRVDVTDQIVAKVVAGMNRVRVRKDARFGELELRALWHHEIESHCLTAHNGALHPQCDFLVAGGPRSTMTQEGLAVFYEVYGHTMSQRRFLSLCNRIEGVRLVEDGADFIELYRWYKPRSDNSQEAFYNAQRVFRGASLKGSAPFTKDVVYLAGLLGVYNFLRIAVKHQNRLLVESLVCGRMALEDVASIAWLRVHGIVNPPYYIPDWLRNWEALLSFFSLSAVFGISDIASFQDYFDEYNRLENWDLSL